MLWVHAEGRGAIIFMDENTDLSESGFGCPPLGFPDVSRKMSTA
jgi:hypothetical protein